MTCTPAAMASSGVSRSHVIPSIVIEPESGACTPEMTLMSVDLPEPFSPARQWISPGDSSRSMPCSAWTPLKDLLTLDTVSNGASICFPFSPQCAAAARWGRRRAN